MDGNYTKDVAGPETVLVFSYLAFRTLEEAVGNRATINVTHSEDAAELSEVVETSLGIQWNLKALQYSVSNNGGEDLMVASEKNLTYQLAGRVSGVNVSNVASGPAGSSRVIIRGNTSLQGNNPPLYVIDGIPMDITNFGQAGMWGGVDEGDGMSSINPDDIE